MITAKNYNPKNLENPNLACQDITIYIRHDRDLKGWCNVLSKQPSQGMLWDLSLKYL